MSFDSEIIKKFFNLVNSLKTNLSGFKSLNIRLSFSPFLIPYSYHNLQPSTE